MDNSPVVSLKNVKKHFGTGEMRVEAIRGVSLEAQEGQIEMIVGPSGSGKTTLLSLIAAILQPDSGEIHVFGTNIAALSENEKTLFRLRFIGFIFQQYNLIPTLTTWENVSIPLLLQGESEKIAREKAFEMLEAVGLKSREKEYPYHLSGGQQQRVAIARALIHEPKLVICDEPTAALDAETGAHVLELFTSRVKKKGRSIMIVTHDARIFKYADRVLHMEDGMIVNSTTGGISQ